MSDAYRYTVKDLTGFQPKHNSFVGIDSDGCVFDTMEIKQKMCFHGLIASNWNLQAIEKQVRECAEFVNLYSKFRGVNRFPALLMTFELLREHPDVVKSGAHVPKMKAMQKWIQSGVTLGNPTLEHAVKETKDPELTLLLKWSKDVNKLVEQTVKNIPPFKWARESLEKISRNSDAICVSQTPGEALIREWKENDIEKYVAVIAAQELGTKAEHIAMATKNRYPANSILMIGDAPSDKRAAKSNNALFYPVNPGHEAESWERFYKQAYDHFLNGTYAGNYERHLIHEFEALLPEVPPWKAPSPSLGT